MRITIVAIGSRGDVQPHIALGVGLKRAGHDVRVATHENFRELITGLGLTYYPIPLDPREIVASQIGRDLQSSGRNPIRLFRALRRAGGELAESYFPQLLDACQGADGIVHSHLGLNAVDVAEKLGIPSLSAFIFPMSRTGVFPSLDMPPAFRLGPGYNRFTYRVTEQALWHTFRPMVNRWRRESLGLKPLPFTGPGDLLVKRRYPTLYAFSPHVVPKPRDWRETIHVCGYWFLDRPADWTPPPGLVDFLDSGPPPVYIGFGSLNNENLPRIMRMTFEAVRRLRQRVIVLTGWSGLDSVELPEEAYKVSDVPHDWLFPRMAVTIHHGGAGTTGSAVRAGVPTIVTPFFADQPFWAERTAALGVGPKPMPLKRLNVTHMTRAIRQAIGDPEMRQRAAELGWRVRAENGTAYAVGACEKYLGNHRR